MKIFLQTRLDSDSTDFFPEGNTRCRGSPGSAARRFALRSIRENEQLKGLLPERSARFRAFVDPYQRISRLQGNQPLIGAGEAIAIR
jgi:hypothetical protein